MRAYEPVPMTIAVLPAMGPCRCSTMSSPTLTIDRPAAPSPVDRVTDFEVASARCSMRSSAGLVVPSA